MKIALVNTTDRIGGASIACFRLAEALLHNKHEVHMLVQEQYSEAPFVIKSGSDWLAKARFGIEKLLFLPYEKSASVRFQFSTAATGQDISTLDAIQQADIIHLHWINKGFLSIKSLQKLAALNKPIVWTLHDMWAFTGGCHYSAHCDHYLTSCGNCFFLKNPSGTDLSNQIWIQKNKLFRLMKLQVVTCSEWLGKTARESGLLSSIPVVSIPNPIDIDFFSPLGTEIKAKPPFTILFQAMNLSDERKGFPYLLEALRILKKSYPELAANINLLIFGKASPQAFDGIDYPVEYLGLLGNETQIRDAYRRAHVFVIPSLEENLPNTIMEAMSCGVPVVGFESGGIPEMIDHGKTGFVASLKDPHSLADGISEVLSDPEKRSFFAKNARLKVCTQYCYQAVADRYLELYQKRMNT